MSAKDTLVGTAKRIVAEIVGDGRLAEEGARQANDFRSVSNADGDGRRCQEQPAPSVPVLRHLETPHMNENQFAALFGQAALKVWPDLPRDAQERLFAVAVDDGLIATSLAEYLHDRHPRTAHPPKPTRRKQGAPDVAEAGQAENASIQTRRDKDREMREAIAEDADKTEGKDRDLVHGDGGTLGLNGDEDLNKDD